MYVNALTSAEGKKEKEGKITERDDRGKEALGGVGWGGGGQGRKKRQKRYCGGKGEKVLE